LRSSISALEQGANVDGRENTAAFELESNRCALFA
jgi:hypothetical protein